MLRRCCSGWGELAKFDDGTLMDADGFRRSVVKLSEDGGREEVRCGPQPGAMRARAHGRVNRRVAKWRLRSPRVYIIGVMTEDGQPRLTNEEIGREVSAHRGGGGFGREHEAEDIKVEEWFLDAVPDLWEAADWRLGRLDLRAAGHSVPGPDGLPCAMWTVVA